MIRNPNVLKIKLYVYLRFLNTYANAQKLIFYFRFPGYSYGFDIILNDLESSIIWAIQIQVSYEKLAGDAHLLKRQRKSKKLDFRCSALRQLISVWYHFT